MRVRVTVVLCASLFLAACGSSDDTNDAIPTHKEGKAAIDQTTQRPSKLVRHADPRIWELIGTDTFVSISADLSGQNAQPIEHAAEIINKVDRSIQAGASDIGPSVKRISIFFRIPDGSTPTKLMTLEFKASDLKHADLPRLGAYGVLDLADTIEARPMTAAQPIVAFCNAHRSEVAAFCASAEGQVE